MSHGLDTRSFDDLGYGQQAAAWLAESGIVTGGERRCLAGLVTRIDAAVMLKRAREDIGKELEGLRQRWAEWDFRHDGNEWAADAKDALCTLRAPALSVLEQKVRHEEDTWDEFYRKRAGGKPSIEERIRRAEANRRVRNSDGRQALNT